MAPAFWQTNQNSLNIKAKKRGVLRTISKRHRLQHRCRWKRRRNGSLLMLKNMCYQWRGNKFLYEGAETNAVVLTSGGRSPPDPPAFLCTSSTSTNRYKTHKGI